MFEMIGEGHKIMAEGPKKEIDLDELERLAKAATPGPWEVTGKGVPEYITDANPNRKIARILRTPRAYEENAHYIVAACNALPGLIAENRALRARVQELEREIDNCDSEVNYWREEYESEVKFAEQQIQSLKRQRDWLAKLLGDLCTAQKDGQCPLFYNCPAAQFGWSCGNAIKENWIYAAEKAEEGDGE